MMKNSYTSMENLYLIPAILLLLVSQFDWSYDFYQLLRVVVSFTAAYHAYALYERKNDLWMLYAGVVILFNPLLPIHLDRSIWAIVDFATAFVFIRGYFKD